MRELRKIAEEARTRKRKERDQRVYDRKNPYTTDDFKLTSENLERMYELLTKGTNFPMMMGLDVVSAWSDSTIPQYKNVTIKEEKRRDPMDDMIEMVTVYYDGYTEKKYITPERFEYERRGTYPSGVMKRTFTGEYIKRNSQMCPCGDPLCTVPRPMSADMGMAIQNDTYTRPTRDFKPLSYGALA